MNFKDLRNTKKGYDVIRTDDGGFINCPMMPLFDKDAIELPMEMHELGVIKCKEPIKICIYHIDEDGFIYYQRVS